MRTTRQLVCIVALVIGCAEQPESSIAEPAYREVRRLEAATEVGVSKAAYDGLLRDVAAEVRVLSDLAVDSVELQSLFHYQDALRAYADAGAVWAAQIEQPPVVRGGYIRWYNLDLAKRYGLAVDSLRSYSGVAYPAVTTESIQLIWAAAAARADSGHRLLVPRLRELRR